MKEDGLDRLNYILGESQRKTHRTMEGRRYEVLVEGPCRSDGVRDTGRTAGWCSGTFSIPNGVKTPAELEGRFLPVKITTTNAFGIAGEPALQ